MRPAAFQDIAQIGAVEMFTPVLCNAGARLILASDRKLITWTQAWGLKTIDTFHTHGSPVL